MSSSSQRLGRQVAPAGSTCQYHGEILASIVEIGEAQIASARAMGGDSLLASLRSREAGGHEHAELNTIRILGRGKGTGATASALLERAPHFNDHFNDATVSVLPFKPAKVYIASDSTAEVAQDEDEVAIVQRSSRMVSKTWNGASSWASSWTEHMTMTPYGFARKEFTHCNRDDPPSEVGRVATNDPGYDISHGSDEGVIDGAVWIIV